MRRFREWWRYVFGLIAIIITSALLAAGLLSAEMWAFVVIGILLALGLWRNWREVEKLKREVEEIKRLTKRLEEK